MTTTAQIHPEDPTSIALWALLQSIEELTPEESHDAALLLVTVAPQCDGLGRPKLTAVLQFLANYLEHNGASRLEADTFAGIVDQLKGGAE